MKGAEVSHNPEEIRSFIAIELPEEVREGLARLRNELKRNEHKFVKWVNPDGLHLTLKFLGNIPSKRVTEIINVIEEVTQGVSAFHLEISGLGAFPSLRQARVFWVGIGGEVDKLSKLQQNIDSALAVLGFAKEERPFVPHLTLARLRPGASPLERRSFGELVDSTIFEGKYHIEVEAVSLMRSQLTPAGAVYTRLSTVELEH
jgi:2'-5' RNA ligase